MGAKYWIGGSLSSQSQRSPVFTPTTAALSSCARKPKAISAMNLRCVLVLQWPITDQQTYRLFGIAFGLERNGLVRPGTPLYLGRFTMVTLRSPALCVLDRMTPRPQPLPTITVAVMSSTRLYVRNFCICIPFGSKLKISVELVQRHYCFIVPFFSNLANSISPDSSTKSTE